MTGIIAHEFYIKACAEALELANIDNADWTAEDDSPRTGSITLDRFDTVFAYIDDTVTLLWDEEAGWRLALTETGNDHFTWIVGLNTEVLPDPSVLAGHVTVALAAKVAPYGDTSRYRSAGDADEFDALLATYATEVAR